MTSMDDGWDLEINYCVTLITTISSSAVIFLTASLLTSENVLV